MLLGLFTILPFTSCLFWMAVLLLDWRRNNAAQHVLAAFIGVSAALYLCHAVFFNHESSLSAVSESVYAFCNIAVFPLYYLYICRLTDKNGLSLSHLFVLLPALIIGLWATILNIFWPDDITAENVRMIAMRTVFVLQLIPICWFGYRQLRRFDEEISNYYADTEERTVRQTRTLMGILVGGAFISGFVNFLGRDYFDSSELVLCLPSFLFTILLFAVGYVGNRQDFCIDDLIRDESEDESGITLPTFGATPKLAGDDNNVSATILKEPSQIITRLDALMNDSQLYLQCDLRLTEVARLLGVGSTTLSQRINQELRLSFSNYINNLRVEHACRLLSDHSNKRISLAGIAELSGFSSDSSFYRAFRRHTGKTPKQFMEES